MFADSVQKINRRGKPEVRDFIVTDTAIYIIIKEIKKKIVRVATSLSFYIVLIHSFRLHTKLCDERHYAIFARSA